jgi:predicted nuclease of predicted toxin-antitoxin system
MGMKATKASKLPDSVSTLNRLLDKGVMVKTPAQDYDDSYCISYARQANAFIVTNDKFRDYLRKIEVNPSMND